MRFFSSERKRLRFEMNLMRKGLVLEREQSRAKVVFVKVHCPFHILCERAQAFQMKLPLKKATLQAVCIVCCVCVRVVRACCGT